jgi:S-layer homology domain
MRRIIVLALAGLMLAALTVPASAHETSDEGATQSARRDHFIEHLLRADIEINQNFVADHLGDWADHEGVPWKHCTETRLTDLNQVVAQTDLDSDAGVDGADDEILVRAICYYTYEDVIEGFPNSTFKVKAHTRRDQAASFTARWVDLHNDGDVNGEFPATHLTPYSDVSQQNVHSGAIWWLSQGGGEFSPPIFQGYGDGTFRPDVSVKNQHAGHIEGRLVDNG